jgi:hypothetical protein
MWIFVDTLVRKELGKIAEKEENKFSMENRFLLSIQCVSMKNEDPH